MILPKITPKHIEDYKKSKLEKVKPPTINRELALLKNMFTVAKKWRYFDGENQVKEVKLFQERELGMRRDKILKLRWNDIDFDKYYIYVKETKGGKSKKIPMNSVVYMVMAGVDLVTVKEILGHRDIRTTLRYCHPTPENKRNAVEVLAAVFGKKMDEEDIKDTDRIDLPHSINIISLFTLPRPCGT